ncbi:hypothetical protein [Tistrella bauzanensis]|jgi:hypothetical protein
MRHQLSHGLVPRSLTPIKSPANYAAVIAAGHGPAVVDMIKSFDICS